MSDSELIRVAPAALEDLVRACFLALGVPRCDADAVADALVDAELRGLTSHGVGRVPAYMRRVAAGASGGTASMREVARHGVLRRYDAGGALGPAAGVKAVAVAIAGAEAEGLALVAVGNSTHFGAAGYYARCAATRNLIALVATNGPANMAPFGSAERFLGTNALALAVPLPNLPPFVLDMSSSVVARGKIIAARRRGESIERGLAIDGTGEPTVDPAAALAGAVLPLGGPKGTGIALGISLLAGILSGAAFDDEAGRVQVANDPRPQNLGQIYLVIDPWRLASRAETETRLAALIDRLHALAPLPGFDRVMYAGERSERERRSRLASGIPVAADDLSAIGATCESLGEVAVANQARALAQGHGT